MNKIKKITAICALLVFTLILSSILSSCDVKPDIYILVENILQNKSKGLYTFDAYLNIKINKNYLNDAMPGELDFKITGAVWDNEEDKNKTDCKIDFALIIPGDDSDIYTNIYKKGDVLYFELNDLSRIILDLLYSTGFIDAPVKTLFDDQVEYDNGSVLMFDLTDFDLSFFDKYIADIKKIFTVKSGVKYNFRAPVSNLSEYDGTKVLYFGDIKNKIEKGLLKLPGYRYTELYAVVGVDEDKNNFMQILATHENGKREVLEKVRLGCGLSKVFENPESLYSENIIPMRYLLELLGETVDWDAKTKKAYIIRGDNKIFFDGVIINSRTYINLTQVITKTDCSLNSVFVDEYIEFKIFRN